MPKNKKLLFSLLLAASMLSGCGAQGPQGEAGPQGPKGETGQQGPQGNTGLPGDNGDDGLSAYELYCQEHPDYKGSLEEWLDEFYKKDETDYSKYDDFLFTEVTYGGVLGYAANYIGSKKDIVYPETFRNLPVLLASVTESSYAPKIEDGEELIVLEKIYFPSTVKVVNITESIKNRYDVSQVTPYVNGGFDRYEAPFYPIDLCFEKGSLDDYRATNLRKYFTFSNVYVKNGDRYAKAVNREDTKTEFLTTKYDNEGGLKSQIIDLLGGTNEFYRFGSFEYEFPKKFTVNFDGYDIDLPLGFATTSEDFNDYPGISFKDNVLKGDETKYNDDLSYNISANVDLGIPNWKLSDVVFHLFRTPNQIKIGDEGVLEKLGADNTYGFTGLELSQGTHSIVIDFGNDAFMSKFPLKCVKGIDTEIKQEINSTSIVIKETGTYEVLVDLNTFELKITPKDLITDISGMLLSKFKLDNGFLDEQGAAIMSKQLVLPSKRQIELKGIKYNIDLNYSFNNDECVLDADTDHPTIFYNRDEDRSNQGFIGFTVKIKYNIGNFMSGHASYVINVFAIGNQNNSAKLKLYVDGGDPKEIEMIKDISNFPDIVCKLNDVVISEDKFSLLINGYEVTYPLASESLGTFNDGYYDIEPGMYNLTLDFQNNTFLIEVSNGELTKLARKILFSYIKHRGGNIYIDEKHDDVVMFTKPDSIDLNFDAEFKYNDVDIDAKLDIFENPDMNYRITDKDEQGFKFDITDGFTEFDKSQELIATLRIDSLFVNFVEHKFEYTLRHTPTKFMIGDAEPTRIENNVYYFDEFVLSQDIYDITLSPNGGEHPGTFKFASGEGTVPGIDYRYLDVPAELKGQTVNFAFNMNTMIVSMELVS